MAANRRKFQPQQVTAGGVTFYGINTVTKRGEHAQILSSNADDRLGAEVDVGSQRMLLDFETSDVKKCLIAMAGTEAATSWLEKKSGSAGFELTTTGVTVWNRLTFRAAFNQRASARLSGAVRFGDQQDFASVMTISTPAATPGFPGELYRPQNIRFTPHVVHSPATINLRHCVSVGFSLNAPLYESSNDVDIGTEAIERGTFDAPELDLAFEDAQVIGATDAASYLCKLGFGKLEVQLKGSGGAVDIDLECLNCKFVGSDDEHANPFANYSMRLVGSWNKWDAAGPGVKQYTLTGSGADDLLKLTVTI